MTSPEGATVTSPFGGPARRIQTLPSGYIVEMYRKKCGADVTSFFDGKSTISLYECEKTGYQFWRPADIAGDEGFYQLLSELWPDYYRPERWEYSTSSAPC